MINGMAIENKILIKLKDYKHEDNYDNDEDDVDDDNFDDDTYDDDEDCDDDKLIDSDESDHIVERKSILKSLKKKKPKVNATLLFITIIKRTLIIYRHFI
jgi:hypothetical protein